MKLRHSFTNFFKESLNPQQKEIVDIKNGIILVSACAGSGKTRVITSRISHLIINHEISSSEIVALTFTNKAANEMKERVKLFIDNMPLPYVGTFHSYCLYLLRRNPHLLPFPYFSILDEDDQLKLIKNILQRHGLNKKFTPKNICSFISRIKNEATKQNELEELLSQNSLLKELFYIYEQEKNNAYCLDFDDILIHTLALFEKHEEFKSKHQNRILHILVDEYQDTNKVQHALLKAMSLKNNEFILNSLCVVGDEDQSIYSWRGATVRNITNFNNDFPEVKTITIEQNYRSIQQILEIANNIIKNNNDRNPKVLWSVRHAKDRIRMFQCSSSYQEGELIAHFLKNYQEKFTNHTLAILYRSHFISRTIEEALIRHTIPYKIIGGIQFYNRLEIKDLLAYLKLILNPYDRVALSRIINVPQRGLGQKFEELFFKIWDQQPFLDFKAIAKNLIKNNELNKTKKLGLQNFLDCFENLSSEDFASNVIEQIIKKTKYQEYLETNFEKQEAKSKLENIKEFINAIVFFEHNTQQRLEKFLEEVALLQDLMHKSNESDSTVYLMTLHAAKGLEFDAVIIPAFEEGILPTAHSIYQIESTEEERRLLYVGITRARERLLFTHTRYRYVFGNVTDQRPSRFMKEIPDEHINYIDISYFNEENIKTYISQWIDKKEEKKINLEKNQNTLFNPGIIPSKASDKNKWYIHQTVSHKSFGNGIIQKIENKNNQTCLIVKFNCGIKKIDSKFLKTAM